MNENEVIPTNVLSKILYGRDVGIYHKNNSSKLMIEYVVCMNRSKWLVVFLSILIYLIAIFDFGSVLIDSTVVEILTYSEILSSLHGDIILFGGRTVDFYNVVLIVFIILPFAFFVGIIISWSQMKFLLEFDFCKFLIDKRVSPFVIVGTVAIYSLFLYYTFTNFLEVHEVGSGRGASLWSPVSGVIGYTIYILHMVILMWSPPSVVSFLYAFIISEKGKLHGK